MTRRTERAVIILALLLACLSISPSAAQTTVAGQLFRQTPYGPYGAQGMMVTVDNSMIGRSYPSYSNQDGWFVLYNIPPGDYNLELWVAGPESRPIVYPISVSPAPLTLPPIQVP
jgi:hypothetical protein